MKRPAVPGGEKYTEIKAKLRELKLHTVCEEAKYDQASDSVGAGHIINSIAWNQRLIHKAQFMLF